MYSLPSYSTAVGSAQNILESIGLLSVAFLDEILVRVVRLISPGVDSVIVPPRLNALSGENSAGAETALESVKSVLPDGFPLLHAHRDNERIMAIIDLMCVMAAPLR